MNRQVRVELGRAWLTAEEAGRFGPGSEVALVPAPAGEADVEVFADGVRAAAGELMEMDGTLCVRVTERTRRQAATSDCGLHFDRLRAPAESREGLLRSDDSGVEAGSRS